MVLIAVDDLGAGYSSSVLADLKPKYIKMDMSIIRDVDTTPRKGAWLSLCRFAEATEAMIVAEGVERNRGCSLTRMWGNILCDITFARPSTEQSDAQTVLEQQFIGFR